MEFELRYFDSARSVVDTVRVTAASADAAREQMPSGAVLSVRAVRTSGTSAAKPDVAWWCRELKTLANAGMTVVEAIDAMGNQTGDGSRPGLNQGLLAMLGQGLSLSEAMRRSGQFPPILVAGVRAGERTSALVPALDDYLRYHEAIAVLKRRATTAAIYPGVVLSVGLAISVVLLWAVVPRFAGIYAGMDRPVGMATRALLAASEALVTWRGPLALAALGTVAGLVWAWRSGRMWRSAEWVLDRWSPFRRLADEFRRAQLFRSLGLLFRGGYPLDEALRQCEGLQLGARMAAAIGKAAEALRSGRRVSDSFFAADLTEPLTQRLLAVGERSGQFEQVLQTIADRHADRFETSIERLTRWIEPVLLLAVSVFVGALVLVLYLPIFDIAGSVR